MPIAPSSAPPDSHLTLVRHARSAHVHAGWIDAHGFRAWRAAYEAAGIHEDERAPGDLAALAARADLLIASDAPRAVASARLLAPGREIVVSPLLRELDLEAVGLGGVRLPLLAWALAVGLRTLYLSLRRQYPSPPEAARLREAASWLGELAGRHPRIVVVTHASFRKSLGQRLAQAGWQAEPGRRTLRPWSAWPFWRGLAEGSGIPPERLLSWQRIEAHLREARTRFSPSAEAESGRSLLQSEEYLEHNEFGLAFESLVEAAEESQWDSIELLQPLALAAKEMGLSERQRYLGARIAELRGPR